MFPFQNNPFPNNFPNNPNNMQGMFGFPNVNVPMQGMNMGGVAWMNMYNLQNPNPNPNQFFNNTGKINVIFRTTKAVKTNITVDFGKTISELIQLYFMRMGKPELFSRPMDICFIVNARKMEFNDQTPVQIFFGNNVNPFVTVNDTKDLIGA